MFLPRLLGQLQRKNLPQDRRHESQDRHHTFIKATVEGNTKDDDDYHDKLRCEMEQLKMLLADIKSEAAADPDLQQCCHKQTHQQWEDKKHRDKK
jgi:hypothetical protein